MLTHSLLKNCAGLLLCGDKRTLEALHEVVHDVNNNSQLIRDKEGAFLGLAYDVRKAFEGQRRITDASEHEPEVGTTFGVEILWPVILFQSRILRVALGHMPHSHRHQAMAYLLEDLIERAITEQFAGLAPGIKDAWRGIEPFARDMEAVLDSRGAMFASWTKAKRQSGLNMLLETMSPRYALHYGWMDARQRSKYIAPAEFADWLDRQWPDPKW